MRSALVSLPKKQLVALLVGVCVLSAGIGSGLALLAQTGPAGPAGGRGPAGPEGPEGPEGASGAEELGSLEAEVEELRGQVEEGDDVEGRLGELESEVSELGGVTSELCAEIEAFC